MNRTAAAPTHAQRDRWRLVRDNALAQAGARGVSAVTQLLVVSILLQTLGLETLGWLLAVMAPVTLAQFADFGVLLAMQQAVSEAHARHDTEGIRRAFASGQQILSRLALGWMAVCLPVAWCFGPLLVSPPTGTSHGELLWIVAVVSAGISLYTSGGARLAAGLQMSWASTFWTAGINGIVVGTLWLLVQAKAAHPIVAALILGCGQFAPGWLTGKTVAAKLKWSGTQRSDSDERRRLWKRGLPLAGAGLTGAATQAITPIVVAAYSGLPTSAAFSILQRFFGPALQGHALLQSPFWPEYTHAIESGHHAWVRPAMRGSLAVATIACAAVAAAALLLPWIMPLWLGTAAPTVHFSLIAWVAAATIAGIVTQPFTYLLLGIDRLRYCSGKIAVAQCVTIGLIALLGWSAGAEGVAAALAIGSTLGVLPILALEAQAALRTLVGGPSTDPLRS